MFAVKRQSWDLNLNHSYSWALIITANCLLGTETVPCEFQPRLSSALLGFTKCSWNKRTLFLVCLGGSQGYVKVSSSSVYCLKVLAVVSARGISLLFRAVTFWASGGKIKKHRQPGRRIEDFMGITKATTPSE